ncbi:MAG: hypothetical protein J6K96_02820 [Treponema sp.]|nr:hypothetical protein [Treponema sp.]
MLTPEEINQKANNQFKEILKQFAQGKTESEIFPLVIRGCNSDFLKDLKTDKDKIDVLIKNCKEKTGKGYSLVFAEKKTKANGSQTVIKKIQFETKDDYLAFTKLKNEFEYFMKSIEVVRNEMRNTDVDIEKWIAGNISKLCDVENERQNPGYWSKICECAHYLSRNKNSALYLRQLPLKVHTKFIEQNEQIIHSLITEKKIGRTFEDEYGLKSKPHLIRFRRLDKNFQFEMKIPGTENAEIAAGELSLASEDFSKLEKVFERLKIKNIYIVENEIVYLTFPQIQNALCIWGHGYTCSVLQTVSWLKNFNLFYFGDLDEHGFDILSKFRANFPNTKSLCMNRAVLKKFEQFRTKGAASSALKNQDITCNLTVSEVECLNELQSDSQKDRLEQEHIDNEIILQEIGAV